MKYIDLSHEIKNNMPVYPGDIDVNLTKEKDFNKDGYNMYSLYTEMHAGTHIDAPLHMKDNKKFISEYPIEKFIGNVALLDVRGEKIIELKDEYYKNIKENDIVKISSPNGVSNEFLVKLSRTVKKNHIYAPMHYIEANSLLPSIFDTYSKEPNFKYVPVKIEKVS